MQHEEFESVTRRLLGDFFSDLTGIPRPEGKQSPALATMKRVVEGLLEKYRCLYDDMINRLSLDDRGDDVTFVSTVARHIFEDGATNWGRIASLISFGAALCRYLKANGRENCVELVGREICSYLLSDQRDWLIGNGGWDGFVRFFSDETPKSAARFIVTAAVVFAGIGAIVATLIK